MTWCAERGIELRYIQLGKPDQNAFIERFNRTYRTEVLNAYVFESLDQVREISADWLQSYNEERPHDALAGLPPATYRAQLEIRSSPLAVITWTATTTGIAGEHIRDLMVEAVERRFGCVAQAPHAIEWLADNGSAYTAHETVAHAHALGLVPCFTPVHSPESNGMAESFVKSFKRDYVFLHRRPDAQSILQQLAAWFDDYNEVRPHRGLRMCSPREFILTQNPKSRPARA